MAVYTLLQLTQQIASSLDSDDINSINDSTESLQIANIIQRAYFDMIKRANLPEHYNIVTLLSGSLANPNLMTIPANVSEIQWIKYNKILTLSDPFSMEIVQPLPLEEFFDRMYSQNNQETFIGSYNLTNSAGYTFKVLYRNDKQPDFYTTFDDQSILFDSYNVNIEPFLNATNTTCYAKMTINFSMSDNFIPNLDEEQFPLLLNEATALAWAELKQSQHAIAERNSRRGWTHVQKSKFELETQTDFNRLPYFGRK
jgi:hypothetical protein